MPNGGGEHLMGLQLREAPKCSSASISLRKFGASVVTFHRTAEFVGMERSALHRKLKALGIE